MTKRYRYRVGIVPRREPCQKAGLTLEHFQEYDYTGGFRAFKVMEKAAERRWVLPKGLQRADDLLDWGT